MSLLPTQSRGESGPWAWDVLFSMPPGIGCVLICPHPHTWAPQQVSQAWWWWWAAGWVPAWAWRWACRMCWKGHPDATSAPTLPWLRPLPEPTGGSVPCMAAPAGVGLARLHGLPERGVQASRQWGTVGLVRGPEGFLGWALRSEHPPVSPLSVRQTRPLDVCWAPGMWPLLFRGKAPGVRAVTQQGAAPCDVWVLALSGVCPGVGGRNV